MTKKQAAAVLVAGLWIVISEFLRNELLLKGVWESHYTSLGLKFQTLPVNGILWFIWSILLAYVVFELNKKFSFWKTVLVSWLGTFAMMWIAAYNLQVFPLFLLIGDIPLSIVEIAVAILIIRKIDKGSNI